jgi:hypothetical protein
MFAILIAAIILAAYAQVRNWRRRERLISQLYSATDSELDRLLQRQEWIELLPSAIQRCGLAKEMMIELAEDARRQDDPPTTIRAIESMREHFHRRGQSLRARLSQLKR